MSNCQTPDSGDIHLSVSEACSGSDIYTLTVALHCESNRIKKIKSGIAYRNGKVRFREGYR